MMYDKNGIELKENQLILLIYKKCSKIKFQYFYIKRLDNNKIYGLRVNRDFSFNSFDIRKRSCHCYHVIFYCPNFRDIEVINPLPEKFEDTLRKNDRCYIQNILKNFGIIIMKQGNIRNIILRVVMYGNGTYGIIQNMLCYGGNAIDYSYNSARVYENLTYDELLVKWDKYKSSMNSIWREYVEY